VLVVVILLLLVAVGLGVQLVRTNARLAALSDDLGEAIRARESADAARRSAEAAADEARKERDDALERANRARRDAADVAKRMKQEADARAEAEAALATAEAAVSGGDRDAVELWALALASVRRTWEVSVAPSPGVPSPLEGSDDELRDAISIEVDAAREEAGAAIDLEWSGDAVVAPATALRALALARELIGRLAKATDVAVLRVCADRDGITLEVTGSDVEGQPAPVEVLLGDVAPEHQVAPGRFELRGATA
jgi:colicin import membrane protein